jgi:hypothetical protein
MLKKIILITSVIIVVAGAGYLFYEFGFQKIIHDEKNATYLIEGNEITLTNGRSQEVIVPGSASKLITQYFGNEVKADFNGDGIKDAAFLITQNSGGSGTFYYVALALGSKNGYQGKNAIFLGDRIAPQTTEFKNGKIIVNYADRKAGQSITTPPSLGISKYFEVVNDALIATKK